MEKEGIVRSLATLEGHGVGVNTIVTDRHPQIQKYLRDTHPSVDHLYDTWHVAKGKTQNIQFIYLFIINVII